MAKRSRGGLEQQGSENRAHPGATLGHLEDCWDEPPPGPWQGRSDVERLQGAWASAGRRRAVFLVSGMHFAIHFSNGDIYMGQFEVDPTMRPRVMLVRVEEGPPHHKGQTALCIYEFEGDTLRWCTSGPGRTDQPTGFPSEDDPNHLFLVFRREQLQARRI
jgi:uncharacterized protein (TIGR03067 family)